MANSLLIIEDEHLLGSELLRRYQSAGWEAVLVETLHGAERMLLDRQHDPLVVLSDMNLPDGNALDLLEKIRKKDTQAGEWVFLTGYGEVPDSVRALRLGAYDFLIKPCEQEHLDLILTGAARSARAQRRLRDEAKVQSRRFSPASFVGHSAAAQRVRDLLARLSGVPFSALIVSGETGTGKGLVARILHHSGARQAEALVEVNCAALPRELLESELFGHEAGAFTGAKGRYRGLMEQANGGTLFLDEIGEMPLDLQAKLLTAIEDRKIRRLGSEQVVPIDVQVVAASNRNLEARVADGSFRSDLYHRLSVVCLDLPALRDRKEDLEDLVPLYVAEYNAKAGKSVTEIPNDVWRILMAHRWPGNVRELRNVVERCVLFSSDSRFPAEWLQVDVPDEAPAGRTPGGAAAGDGDFGEDDGEHIRLPLDGSMALDDMDRHIIETALRRHHYNVAATARALCTTRNTLRYRIQKYNLQSR